jgi:GT2 family glycosyltransferase
MNTCDIIIPTHNGEEKLRVTIPALLEQDIPADWSVRVIISDDGSDRPLGSVISEYTWKGSWAQPLLLRSAHTGRSHARNLAINAATADILLLLADDIAVRPHALKEHLLFHAAHKEHTKAALGCVLWDPRIRPTPFMDWMMHGGQQNDYDSLLGVSTCSASHYFYGSFVSIKREFLDKEDRFSEEFSSYGWEDLELGARLETKGLDVHVLHNARALHCHRYTAEAILKRQRIVGSAKYLVNTNSIRRVYHAIYGLSGARAIVRYILSKWGDILNMPRLFALATAGEFWYGVHHANRLLKSEKK